HAGRGLFDARCCDHAIAVAAGLLRYPDAEASGAADEIRGALVHTPRIFGGTHFGRARHEKVTNPSKEPGAKRRSDWKRARHPEERSDERSRLVKHYHPSTQARRISCAHIRA